MDTNHKAKQEPEDPADRYVIESGELLIWRPARPMTEAIPVVCLGAFRSGKPAISFRMCALKRPGLLSTTSNGIAISFDELAVINRRLEKIAEGLSDAA